MPSWFDSGNTGVSGGGGSGLAWESILGGLGGLWGGVQSMGVNNGINGAVGPALQQNLNTTGSQIGTLQQQIAADRARAEEMYNRSRGDVEGQNTQLQGNIDTLTGNLNALSDPNSPYMQMARQGIERKDAAAGRRSQWGEREVQLAAQLADYVGKYAPGIQNSITGARNQINQNNQGLASLFNNANVPSDRNQLALQQMLQQQQSGANALNTTGRQAATAQSNSLTNLLGQAGRMAGGGLGSLFGGMFGGGGGQGITDLWGGNTGIGSGGWGNAGSSNYGSEMGGWGFGDSGLGYGQGFTGGGLGGGYLGLGGDMSMGSGLDFQSGGLGGGLQGYGYDAGGGLFDNSIW